MSSESKRNFEPGKLTVAQRLKLLERMQSERAAQGGGEPDLVARDRSNPIALSFAQQRLWFLGQLKDKASAAYHIACGLKLTGLLDRGALQAALDRIVQRHEALRTSFVLQDEAPVQRINAPQPFELIVHEQSTHPQAHSELKRLSEQEADAAFDLSQGPLIRGRLIVLGEQEHVLLITMHHIVSDGWSLGRLTHELGVLYEAYSRGQPDPLPALAIQYADYAQWQRHWAQGAQLQAQLAYWREQLQDAPALLELPSDRPRPAVQDYAGGRVDFELDAALTQALKDLSARHGTTLYMTLLAGWAALLYRLSGQDDLVIGSPVAGRTRSELEPLIGLFVNTLALRLRVDGRATVSQLLAQARQTTLQAQAHQDLPFEQLVEAVNPERSLGHSPLFQTMLAWQNTPQGKLQLSGLHVEPVTPEQVTAKFDLLLSMGESGQLIDGCIEYASAMFDHATVARWIEHWRVLLQAMARDDTQAIDRLPLLTAPQRRQLMVDWNATHADYPRDQCLHGLIETQVRRSPEAVAVVHEGESLSYAELNRRANQLAHHLRTLGVGPDMRVAICLPRSAELVIALLATLKAGAAYVPLDPAYPAQRLAFMLEDCHPTVLVSRSDCAQELPASADVPLLWLDAPNPAWLLAPQHDPAVPGLTPAHLAYVIYTSGSTGAPKGVMVAHAQVAHLLRATQGWFDFSPSDVWTLFHSYAFDFSVWEIWGALLHGGRLVVVPHMTARSPQRFYELLCTQGVTVLNQTPSAFRQLMGLRAPDVPAHALRLVIFGGEALVPSSLAPWYAQHGSRTQLVNMYGITETTVHVTHRPLSQPDTQRAGHSPIGRCIPDLQAHVVDRYGQLCPIGVAGELHITGAGLARGYLNRPELTAERFVPDPFGAPGSRMYRSGDLARWCADGTLDFLGRNDHQIKIRGFRIELGEIEAALQACPGVREAVVLPRQDGEHQRLVAYLVAVESCSAESLSPEALRAQLSTRLPEHMLPAAYVRLPILPLSPNGKLDRRALPAPEGDDHELQAYEEPQGPIETTLARLWAELLGLQRVGRHDHFFALGGHSLLAVQLLARMRPALGREVALAQLFAHPVLGDFARITAQAAPSALPAIPVADRQSPMALSFEQQRLWFLGQLEDKASAAYHIACGLKLTGLLDRSALRAALDRIVRRHEALRTSFVLLDGAPVQRIGAPQPFELIVHELGTHPKAHSELKRLSEQEANAAFDLSQGPLIRGRLIVLGEQEHVLLITMHHIVSDGWSLGRLTHELGVLYDAYSRGQPDPMPPLAIQYADYAQWQRHWAQGPQLQAQLAYWREQLRDAPALLDLPSDRPRPAVQNYAGGHVDFQLDAALTQALKDLSARHGTTLYMTLLAGWAALLYRLSGQDDLVIGSPVAGRTRSELEPLIGLFVNTLALRLRVDGRAMVSDLLAQARHTTLQAQAHQDLPFEQLVEAVNPERSLGHSPLFQTMLAWQNTPQGKLQLSGLHVEPVTPEQVTAKFDLLLSMEESGRAIDGCIEYASAMFDHATVARWIEHWRVLLQAMAGDDTQAIERLPLLTAPQRRQVLIKWNATQADYPRERCIHELIEAQVCRSPDAVAVTHGSTNLTYAELNAQANRLAHYLIALGVTADERVAIAMPRGVAMLVGLLAILKSGGAYVPIDPAYPAQRVAYMLHDAAPKVLLTKASLKEDGDWSAYLPSERIVCLDTDVRHWSGQPEHDPMVHISPHHLAYVIYTSGSTGEPKGVMVPHAGVVNLLTSMRRIVDMHSEDRLLAITTLNFDIAALELHGPLICGAKVVIADRDTVLDPVNLARCIEEQGITVLQATPHVWRLLLDSGWSGGVGLKALCGGEALSNELAQRLQSLGLALWNLYGPTETTIWSTAHRVLPRTHVVGSPPIGHPVANTRIYVLDALGEPTPPGVIGEIHIAGDGVARGYLHRPQLTQERFISDRFAPATHGQAPAHMYRTGDLGCWRADGVLEYHGRNDFEVKIRGIRIHPAEIESTLARHPGVREVAVVAHEQGAGHKQLVAYIAPRAVDDTEKAANGAGAGISFSLFYFGAEVHDEANKYGVYLESAQYADRNGFEAVWTPERHFNAVGGLYANPSVLTAALAVITKNIKLRSGSIVLPLHHPVRVAEDWAMVDNLSRGRAGLSIASGWHPQDFVLAPDSYALRKQEMLRGIEVIRALWRGESIALPNGAGDTSEVRIFPRPLQQEVPLWITAAGNRATFVQAGKTGANVLTHLLGQSMADLAEQIASYRQARLEAGHDPEAGRVTLMIHTFVGTDVDKVRQQAKRPFINYLKSHVGLNSLAQGLNMTAAGASALDVEALCEMAYEHYWQTSALIGTPESCLPLVQEAKEIGVDEVACLIDWMDGPSFMEGLAHLNHLRELSQRPHPSWRDLRRFLAAGLPQHMIPSAAVFVDSLPVTANGKLDRKALPAPSGPTAIIVRYEAPSGPRETAIAQLWAELFGLLRVGRHDNFFELGGNSLMVVTMLERLRQAGMPAEVRMLFANPTPASLAASMASGEAAGDLPETIEVTF